MRVILFVRAKSSLQTAQLERRVVERKPQFAQVPGLIQKVYGRHPATGDWCGIHLIKDGESMGRFRQSALARTIGSACEATEVRPEVLELQSLLHPERGPPVQ